VFRRSPHVRFRLLPGQMALFNAESGDAVALDEIGSEVWQLLAAPMELYRIAGHLSDDYAAPEDRVVTDVARLVGELVATGFLEEFEG